MNKSGSNAPVVACFGEILWDCLPRGLFLGGAPLNVAYHLRRLGVCPRLISAVGWDFLGEEALRRMDAWGLDVSFVARRGNPTGTAHPIIEPDGTTRHTFDPSPAWDHISGSLSLVRRTAPPAALVFGTLALREASNRNTLEALLVAWPESLRVVDLNLCPPFDRVEAVNLAFTHASLLKLNADELATLLGQSHETPAGIARSARRFARQHRLKHVCVTAGARGAGLLWDDEWHWVQPQTGKIDETRGMGDAFLAGLLAGLLARQEAPADALARASRLCEFVATQEDATPCYRCDASGQLVSATP